MEPTILVAGVSHHTAGVSLREGLAFGASELPQALPGMRDALRVPELMILSTCNRVEVYAAGDETALARVLEWLRARGRADAAPDLYQFMGEDAARHAFRV